MHYSLLLLTEKGQNWEEQLEPFAEDHEVEPYVKIKKETLEELKKEDKDFCMKHFLEEYDCFLSDDGNLYTTRNPKPKFDYYRYGGRFDCHKNTFLGKEDSCLVKNIKRGIDEELYKFSSDDWDRDKFVRKYYKKMYGDKETFCKICSSLLTYSVLTPDGVWHESSNKYDEWFNEFNEILDNANPEWECRFLDLHI